MSEIAKTPVPPYYAVIFTSVRTPGDNGYGEIVDKIANSASMQKGFLGAESVRDSSGFGMTMSYWDSLEGINGWKSNLEHKEAKERGMKEWYSQYMVRICKVENDKMAIMAPGFRPASGYRQKHLRHLHESLSLGETPPEPGSLTAGAPGRAGHRSDRVSNSSRRQDAPGSRSAAGSFLHSGNGHHGLSRPRAGGRSMQRKQEKGSHIICCWPKNRPGRSVAVLTQFGKCPNILVQNVLVY